MSNTSSWETEAGKCPSQSQPGDLQPARVTTGGPISSNKTRNKMGSRERGQSQHMKFPLYIPKFDFASCEHLWEILIREEVCFNWSWRAALVGPACTGPWDWFPTPH